MKHKKLLELANLPWNVCPKSKPREEKKEHKGESIFLKGQLISECLLGVIDFPKNQQKIWQISALESKKWSNQQSKSTFL